MSALILASKSASRRAMLDAAGVAYETIPAAIDERALEAGLQGASPAELAEALAVAKAAAVAVQYFRKSRRLMGMQTPFQGRAGFPGGPL